MDLVVSYFITKPKIVRYEMPSSLIQVEFVASQMRIEGLQALKPQVPSSNTSQVRASASLTTSSMEYLECGDSDFIYTATGAAEMLSQNGAANIEGLEDFDIGLSRNNSSMRLDSMQRAKFSAVDPSVTSNSGFDVEIRLVEQDDEGDYDIGMGGWVVKSCKAAVREPVSV